MTTQEIKIAGFRLFEQTAIAVMNVFNGCISDEEIVKDNCSRLQKMYSWFVENDMEYDLQRYSRSNKFSNSSIHFYTEKLFDVMKSGKCEELKANVKIFFKLA